MKKVFSVRKCVMWLLKTFTDDHTFGRQLETTTWIYRCQGLTAEECAEKGFRVSDDWLVEIEITQ